MSEINSRIKKIRNDLKLTQLDVANALGMNLSTYSQREREGNNEAEFLIELSKIFNVDVKQLLYNENEIFENQIKNEGLSSQEKLIIKIFRRADDKNKEKLLKTICEICDDI